MSGERTHRGKRGALQRWLDGWEAERRALPGEEIGEIGETEWDRIKTALEPISPAYLRRLLRDAASHEKVKLSPLVEGVRQTDLDALAMSLLALAKEYLDTEGNARRQRIRSLVIEAKEHAQLSSRNPDKRAVKLEMVLWMKTWLENPPLFPAWVGIRRQATGGRTAAEPEQHGNTET